MGYIVWYLSQWFSSDFTIYANHAHSLFVMYLYVGSCYLFILLAVYVHNLLVTMLHSFFMWLDFGVNYILTAVYKHVVFAVRRNHL